MKTILVMMILLFAAHADAAQIHVEDFSAGASSAQGNFSLQAGTWTFTGGVARAQLYATAPYAIPDTAVLRPSAAAFTGNYAQAGIEVMGFRFQSGRPRPSALYLELTGGGSVFQKVFPAPQEGQWQTFMVSMQSLQAGGWTVKSGSAQDFPSAIQNVRSVELKIHRSGADALTHAVDDFFVDGLPKSGVQLSMTGPDMSMSWDALQPGASYTMQQSPSLAGPWTDIMPVPATNRLQHINLPRDSSADQLFYRLRGP